MRIWKPSYSKPLPKGAKAFLCKQGKDKGRMLVKFKDARNHTQTARLTRTGDKILVEVNCWHISFEDSNRIKRKLKAYTNERETQRLADRIQEILDGQPVDAE